MTTIISFIVVLGFLILVHELGHFLVAKKLGVKVEKFSIGFGPKIVGFSRGETEYMISAFPLGGYVKLMGEEPDETLVNDPREFGSRPVSHRMAIIIAGPLMNLLLTFILFPLVFMMGVNMPAFLDEEVNVGWIMEDSPAEAAGIQPGDVIKSANGKTLDDWEKAVTEFAANPGRKLTLEVLRKGSIIKIDMTPRYSDGDGSGYSGIIQPMPPEVGSVSPGMPAAKAGIREGDVIESVNGVPVSHWVHMSNLIKGSGGKEIAIGVARDSKAMELKLKPVLDEASGNYIIGVGYRQRTVLKKYGFFDSLREGIKRGFELTALTFDVLKRLFTLNLSLKSLGGPIMIAQATGAAAHAGLAEVIGLMAFISLQLGILNLLPIPVLDGGHVFFLLAEMGLRRPISIKTREIAQQIGFIILILLMLIVSYNDIRRILPF